jgi:hypothetical protein
VTNSVLFRFARLFRLVDFDPNANSRKTINWYTSTTYQRWEITSRGWFENLNQIAPVQDEIRTVCQLIMSLDANYIPWHFSLVVLYTYYDIRNWGASSTSRCQFQPIRCKSPSSTLGNLYCEYRVGTSFLCWYNVQVLVPVLRTTFTEYFVRYFLWRL